MFKPEPQQHDYDVLPLRTPFVEPLVHRAVDGDDDQQNGLSHAGKQTSSTGKYFWSEAFLDHVDELRLLDSTWSSELKDPIIVTTQRDGVRQLLPSVSCVEERSSQEAILEGLLQHVHDFETAACSYARVIVGELGLPEEQKTIHAEKSLGFAGGEKYIVSGILFKFCLDDRGMYGGDENAAKVGGHELRGASVLFNLQIPALHVPLMTLVDIFGFRLAAVSLVPINHQTLVYGSDDRGMTVVASDNYFNRIMEQVGASLGLKSHQVQDKSIHGAADMEGHVLQPGSRYIVIDIARLFPPQSITPASPFGSHLFRMLRPNAVRTNSTPLSSDAFCRMGAHNCREHNQEVLMATQWIRTTVVENCSDYLNSHPTPSSEALNSAMHSFGLNIRFLYLVYQLVSKTWHPCILVEMSARAVKTIVRKQWRECTRQQARASPDRCHQILIDVLNDLLPELSSPQYSEYTWSVQRDIGKQKLLMKDAWLVITAEIEKKFGFFANGGQALGLEMDVFLQKVNRQALLLRTGALLGVTFGPKVSLGSVGSPSFRSRLLTRSSILRIDPVVRSIDVVTILAAKMLFLSSLREISEMRSYEMLLEAFTMLSHLSGSAGESSALSLALAAVLNELAVRCDIKLHPESGTLNWGLSALQHLYRVLKIEIRTHARTPPTSERNDDAKSQESCQPKWLDTRQWEREWSLALPTLGERATPLQAMINRALLAAALNHYPNGDAIVGDRAIIRDKGERFYAVTSFGQNSIVAAGHTGNVYGATYGSQGYASQLLRNGLCSWIQNIVVLPSPEKKKPPRLAMGSVTFPEVFITSIKAATLEKLDNDMAVEALGFAVLGKLNILFAGLSRGLVQVWDVTGETAKLVAQLTAHFFHLGEITVLENSWLVTAGLDHTCCVFDLRALSLALSIPRKTTDPLPRFGPVCVIGNEGNDVFELGHVAGVTSVDLCRIQGHIMLVSGSFDRTARVRVLSPLSSPFVPSSASVVREAQSTSRDVPSSQEDEHNADSDSGLEVATEWTAQKPSSTLRSILKSGSRSGSSCVGASDSSSVGNRSGWSKSCLGYGSYSSCGGVDNSDSGSSSGSGSTCSSSSCSGSSTSSTSSSSSGKSNSDNTASNSSNSSSSSSSDSGGSGNVLAHSCSPTLPTPSSYCGYQPFDETPQSSPSPPPPHSPALPPRSTVSLGPYSSLHSSDSVPLTSSCVACSAASSSSLISSTSPTSCSSSSLSVSTLTSHYSAQYECMDDEETSLSPPDTTTANTIPYTSLTSSAFLPPASNISSSPPTSSSHSVVWRTPPSRSPTHKSQIAPTFRHDKPAKLLGLRTGERPRLKVREMAPPSGESMQSSLVYTCFGHQDGIWCVRWLGSGGLLATGSSDWTVRLWLCDPVCEARRFCLRVLRGHVSDVFSLHFELASRRLLTGGGDGCVKWWDLSHLAPLMGALPTSPYPFVFKVSDLVVQAQ